MKALLAVGKKRVTG